MRKKEDIIKAISACKKIDMDKPVLTPEMEFAQVEEIFKSAFNQKLEICSKINISYFNIELFSAIYSGDIESFKNALESGFFELDKAEISELINFSIEMERHEAYIILLNHARENGIDLKPQLAL